MGGKNIAALRAAKDEALQRAKTVKHLLESEWAPLAFHEGEGTSGAAKRV